MISCAAHATCSGEGMGESWARVWARVTGEHGKVRADCVEIELGRRSHVEALRDRRSVGLERVRSARPWQRVPERARLAHGLSPRRAPRVSGEEAIRVEELGRVQRRVQRLGGRWLEPLDTREEEVGRRTLRRHLGEGRIGGGSGSSFELGAGDEVAVGRCVETAICAAASDDPLSV